MDTDQESVAAEHRSILGLSARDAPYTVIVEPWADEFQVNLGETCRVVASNTLAPPTFEVELHQGVLVVWVQEGGSTYEFWRGGAREFLMPIATPFLPQSTLS